MHGEYFICKNMNVERDFNAFLSLMKQETPEIIAQITDPSDNSQKYFQIEQSFPILFLSQNEIIKIAEDKSGVSHRKFIDNFLIEP